MLGKLLNRNLSFNIEAECANSGRKLEIALDSDLNILQVTKGADPMVCLPIVRLVATASPSIVDIF